MLLRKVRLSTIADGLVIVLALGTLWTWYSRHQTITPAAKISAHVGKTLTGPGIDWSKAQRNWVLVLSKDCRFCSESIPFYRRLVANSGKTRVNVAFPHDIDSGREYLAQAGLKVHSVSGDVRLPWSAGTPTLFLCDSKGKIVKEWIGKLSSASEAEVMLALIQAND